MGDGASAIRRWWVLSLGLPGMQELVAQEEGDQLAYRYSIYDEDPLPDSLVIDGATSRYRIESHLLSFDHDLGGQFRLNIGYLHEAMSGASPWFVFPDPEAGPLQVMSGATIRETRDDLNVTLSRQVGQSEHGILLGFSTEDDYEARYAAYSGEYTTQDFLTTWSWGFSLSDDELRPTDPQAFGRIEQANRDSRSVSLAASRVINRNLLMQAGLSVTRQRGFLSDPYKRVWVGSGPVNDSRPRVRDAVNLTLRNRLYLADSKSALHVDYRFFADDWSVTSHTLDLAWHLPLSARLDLVPEIRYYSQSAADFYDTSFVRLPADGFASSDYRLATFGALSYKLGLVFREERWHIALNAEYYDSDESLALSGTSFGTPGLVDFWRLSLGLVARW